MEPTKLAPENFAQYPPRGSALAIAHIELLRRIPLSLLPMLLIQFRRYDFSFPVEMEQLDAEIAALESSSPSAFATMMKPFGAIAPPSALADMDWPNQPQQFTERLTAWLWSQQRIDDYHAAAESYRQAFLVQPAQAAMPRWTFVLIGRDAPAPTYPLFRKLAPHGTLFTGVNPAGGAAAILAEASDRAAKHPIPYSHWYIDGSDPLPGPGLVTTSYKRLVPAARKEFQLLQQFTSKGTWGSSVAESETSYVASLTPQILGVDGAPYDPLRYFEVSILTQGAGCQIYSTTFVQWAARECLRRAQPVTLVARFANRQMAAPMEQLLNRDPLAQREDPAGSLVDADMGAYYTWINQSRLSGSEQSRFLAWWEGHDLALAISPLTARGATSNSPCDLLQIIDWVR